MTVSQYECDGMGVWQYHSMSVMVWGVAVSQYECDGMGVWQYHSMSVMVWGCGSITV